MPPKSEVLNRKKDAESQLGGKEETAEENGADGDGGIDQRQRNLKKNEDAQKPSQFSNQRPKPKPEEEQSDHKELTTEKDKNAEKKEADVEGDEGGNKSTDQATKKKAENIPGRNEGEGDNKKFRSILINFCGKGLFLAAAVVACIGVIAHLGLLAPLGLLEGDVESNFDLVKDFGDEVDKLQLSFTNQTDRFWKILKSRGLAHLQDKDPLQPLVFLLAAPPAAHEWVDCLAIQLAEKLDPGHQRTLARIYGEKEKGNPPDTTKKTMDNFLKEKFEAGHRVALIHHLELLPPLSPLPFYPYCDDQNAPHKHVAIIFTVHMPVEPSPSLSPKEAEESVEEYLSGEVWAKVDKDAVAALLSRIADIVVLMKGESSGSAKELCSLSAY